jgi:biopolymer transport protein TolQ
VELITNAGLVVKVVLLILAYFSVTSWAIIIYKSLVVHRAISDSAKFLDFFWARRRFDAISQGLGGFRHSPLAVLFRDVHQELLQSRRAGEGAADGLDADLGEQERVARVLRRATTSETHRLEKYLAFLATTGSAAPFIGLFGTVWGIMDAFHGIGKSGSASLAVVAPGISEALVATAIGLVAAIPAVIAYNHFLNKVNVLIGEMDSFSQELLNVVQRLPRSRQER